jgi:hypothetical protein
MSITVAISVAQLGAKVRDGLVINLDLDLLRDRIANAFHSTQNIGQRGLVVTAALTQLKCQLADLGLRGQHIVLLLQVQKVKVTSALVGQLEEVSILPIPSNISAVPISANGVGTEVSIWATGVSAVATFAVTSTVTSTIHATPPCS